MGKENKDTQIYETRGAEKRAAGKGYAEDTGYGVAALVFAQDEYTVVLPMGLRIYQHRF